MKLGIIDVGGGYRDIYGAGVLDVCMEENIVFDTCIGVSAGSANLASYLSGQPGRSYICYLDYVFRKKYMSFRNWVFRRNYTDTSYLYDTIWSSGGENPFNFKAFSHHPADFFVAACNAISGELIWFDKSHFTQDCYQVLKAACALPIINTPVTIAEKLCLDGGMCDPVPVKKALEEGCDKLVVILTRPIDTIRTPKFDRFVARMIEKRFPAAAQRIRTRSERYNEGVAHALRLQEEGKAIVVAPDSIKGLSTLTRDREKMQTLYEKGVADAKKVLAFIRECV